MNSCSQPKRLKSELACAECRRLKIRCDRQVPCATCIKRGCAVLCPDGTMPPGGASRFVGIAEEFLRGKIAKMEARMHSLEDALAIIQGSTSHYKGSNGDSDWRPKANQDSIICDEFSKYGLSEVLRTLYIDDYSPSDAQPLGTSGNSECVLLQAKVFVAESPSLANYIEEIDPFYLPSEIRAFYQAFPFKPPGISVEAAQHLIGFCLPPLSRAMVLCETFLQSMSWMFGMVSRQHILGELIPTVYKYATIWTPTEPRSFGPHDIALLFVILAIGALVDPSLPPYNIESQHYHILSRAALSLQPVLAQRSVITIKTLHLMSVYSGMCGIDSKLDDSFSLLNMAAQVALQIGFHKDPSAWGISGKEAYERRMCFWDLLHKTLWQSLIAGQPPVIMPSLIDCRIPTKEEEDMYGSGEVPAGCGTWCFGFAIQCLVPIVEVTQAIHPPSYDAVLALDHKIRQFSDPPVSSNEQISGQVQANMRSQVREFALLFLHRSFFAQALLDCPWNPLMSPYRQSFLTAYESAIWIIDALRKLFAQQSALCARIWRIWSFAFSAAVTIGAVAVKRLSIQLEPEPFDQLDLACTLFREAAPMSVRARKALPILLRLHREATRVQLECESGERDINRREGARDSRRSPADSLIRLIHYPPPGVPCSEPPVAPTPEFMQARTLPGAHLSLPNTVGSDQELYTSSIQGAALDRRDPYCESSSMVEPWNGGARYEVPPENQRSSFIYNRIGTYMLR